MVTYSTNLALTLMDFGDNDSTWGNITNSNLGTLLEQSIVGEGSVAMSDGTTTITMTNGASATARCFFLILTGSLTAQRTLVVPTVNKPYIIKNSTTGGFSVVVQTSGGAGVTVPNGQNRFVYADGTDVIEALNSFGNLSVNGTLAATGNTTVGGTLGVTGAATLSSTLGVTGNTTLGGTLAVTGAVSGAGFTSLFASPPAIGGTAPAAGSFTTLAASGTVSGAGFVALHATPGPIGNGTPSTGAFTTLSASSTVSGAGFSTYLASPPAIGGTAPAAGAFTTLSANSTVSGSGFTAFHSSPGPIGNTTPSTGAFTTLTATTATVTTISASTYSGSGISSIFASPPAIGSSAPAAGSFTTLAASGTVSGAGFTSLFASPPAIGGTSAAAGSFTTIAASGTISGTNQTLSGTLTAAGVTINTTLAGSGVSTYLASPPAIGGTAPAAGTFTAITGTGLTVNGNASVTGTLSVSTAVNGPSATITALSASSITATSVAAGSFNGIVGNGTPAAGTFTTLTAPTISGATYMNGTMRVGQNSTDSPGVSNTTTGIGLPTSGAVAISYNGSALNVNRNSDGTIATFYRSGNSPGGGITITTTTLAFTSVSDMNKKKNWKPMKDPLERIRMTNPVTFQWKINDEEAEGFLAQELQEVVPGAVFKGDDGLLSVDPGKMMPLVFAALKELDRRLDAIGAGDR